VLSAGPEPESLRQAARRAAGQMVAVTRLG